MKTILVALDFSPLTEPVLAHATELACTLQARLVVLHVITPIPVIGKNLGLTVTGAELTAAAKRKAAEKLGRMQRTLRNRGVFAHAVQVAGTAVECILEQAERLEADLIVLGSHGHRALYDLLVGSTGSGILQRATCPVVIVPRGMSAASSRRCSTPALASC